MMPPETSLGVDVHGTTIFEMLALGANHDITV